MCYEHTSSPLIGQSCYLTSEEGKRSETGAGAGVAGVRAARGGVLVVDESAGPADVTATVS